MNKLDAIKAFAACKVNENWIHTHWLAKDMTVSFKSWFGRLCWGLAKIFPWIQERYFSHINLKESQKVILASIDTSQLNTGTIEKIITNFNSIVNNLNQYESKTGIGFKDTLLISKYDGETGIIRALERLADIVIRESFYFYKGYEVTAFAQSFTDEDQINLFNEFKKTYYSSNDFKSKMEEDHLRAITPKIQELEFTWTTIKNQVQILERKKLAAHEKRENELLLKLMTDGQEQKQLPNYSLPIFPKSLKDVPKFLIEVEERIKFFDEEIEKTLPTYIKLNSNVQSGLYSQHLDANKESLKGVLFYETKDV